MKNTFLGILAAGFIPALSVCGYCASGGLEFEAAKAGLFFEDIRFFESAIPLEVPVCGKAVPGKTVPQGVGRGADGLRGGKDIFDEPGRWAEVGFVGPSAELSNGSGYLEQDQLSKITHVFDMTVFVEKSSRWTREEIDFHFRKTAKIYSQCGIGIGVIKWVWADFPEWKIFHPFLRNGSEAALAKLAPKKNEELTFFLIDRYLNGFTAIAHIKAYERREYIINSIFIAHRANLPEALNCCDPTNSLFAHELAHIIGNRTHVIAGNDPTIPEKNILYGGGAPQSGDITPEQCRDFRASPVVRKK